MLIVKNKLQVRMLIISILILYILISCNNEKKEVIDQPFDREIIPSIEDDSVTMFISDSGVIRYKVLTDKWQIFDGAKDPHWFFPEGLYIERFNPLFMTEATIKADTAWNYTLRKTWRLKGNVFIKNIKNETFNTEELFWDEKVQKIYSDKYIEIKRPNKLELKGFGFESNTNMTEYKIFRPHDTNLYVNENEKSESDPQE